MRKILMGATCAVCMAGSAHASAIYTGSGTPGGLNVTASATFTISGSDLLIALTSASTDTGAFGPSSGLSGLFFSITGNPTLTPASATVAPGSSIVHACDVVSCTGVTNLDGEWGYQYSASGFSGTGAPAGNYGIASSGYLNTGLTGDIGNFNGGAAGTNLDGPTSLDGPNFEIFPTGVTFSGGTGGLATTPVVESEVDFVLTNLPANVTLSDITNVNFQFGTSFGEPNLSGTCTSGCNSGTTSGGAPAPVPEPASLPLLAAGLFGLGLVVRRARRA